jgi:hypothetical protein
MKKLRCRKCRKPLGPNNRRGYCQVCRRRQQCRVCGEVLPSVRCAVCPPCRVVREMLSRQLDNHGGVASDEHIARLRVRAEGGLPLFPIRRATYLEDVNADVPGPSAMPWDRKPKILQRARKTPAGE